MHLALIRHRLASLGGAETTLLALTRELVRQGHTVTVLTADEQRPRVLAGLDRVHWCHVPTWPGKLGRIWGFAVHARRLVQTQRFDLVYSLERTLAQDAYRAGDGCHREWLARRQEYDSPWQRGQLAVSPFHRLLLFLEARLYRSPDLHLVIANSRQVKEEVHRHYQVPLEKVQVIYNGVEQTRFRWQPGGIKLTCPVILFVGSGFKRKGLRYLIAALAALRSRRVQLLVVGQDRLQAYRSLAKKLGVVDRITFLGPQPQVEEWYQRVSLLALPTIYDPCANVVLEALACGRPVVTTAANGAAEFITPGVNGAVLARPDDIPGLAAALEEFLERANDPAVQQAAVAAVAALSWERTVSETLAALTSVGQRRP